MASPFHDFTLMEDADHVSVADRGEPMCNDKAGAPLQNRGDRLLNELLGLRIDGGGMNNGYLGNVRQ